MRVSPVCEYLKGEGPGVSWVGLRGLSFGMVRSLAAGPASGEAFALAAGRLRTSRVGIGEDQFNPANQSARGGPETSTTAGGELGSAGGRS